MKYTVSISFYDFFFDNLSDACTFCELARRSNHEEEITLKFNIEETENTNENND